MAEISLPPPRSLFLEPVLIPAFSIVMSQIRSKRSIYCVYSQLLIPAELAHDTVQSLGEVGQLQFKDLNTSKSAFQRTYANQATISLFHLPSLNER